MRFEGVLCVEDWDRISSWTVYRITTFVAGHGAWTDGSASQSLFGHFTFVSRQVF